MPVASVPLLLSFSEGLCKHPLRVRRGAERAAPAPPSPQAPPEGEHASFAALQAAAARLLQPALAAARVNAAPAPWPSAPRSGDPRQQLAAVTPAMLLSALSGEDPGAVPEAGAGVGEGGFPAPAARAGRANECVLRTKAAVPFSGSEHASQSQTSSAPSHSMPSAHAMVSAWPRQGDAAQDGLSAELEWQQELDALQRLRMESAEACSLCGGPKEEVASSGGPAGCLYCERLGG